MDKSKWIQFSNIDGLVINGDGHIDGQGYAWWKSCFPNKESWGCKNRPTALHFNKCNGLQLSELSHLNSPRNHISISSCDGVHISHLNIFAPEESPNTDGIDISTSRNIEIKNSVIQTGDDCVAINQGSSYINISSVACGPGHGISIGSLGKNGNYETVEEVHVRDCNFTGTQNGARIKTWKGGSGYARKISFENIRVRNSQNPIIIDQNYDPFGRNAGSQKAVKVSDVTFKNVRGTAAEELAIDLICSLGMGCTNILLDNIDIQSSIPGKRTYSRCNNVHGTARACNPVVPCVASS
ncbi:probable polygalacturonase At3g15720 [Carya illinoinensis]|uniref:probable polygalacturonase At3g15720 n=1 Tax=Carya illinoinensis TaxID=32201 RepID=UPI001C726985|nr:probable polygalacturonase At3g15720 [Carya illinoinensis]